MSVDLELEADRVGETSVDRILDAAYSLMCSKGFAGTAISSVEKESGLPASSIYHHFGSKNGLCAAVVERAAARWVEQVRQKSVPGRDAEETISLHLRNVTRALDDEPEFLRLLIMLSLERGRSSPETVEAIRAIRENARSYFAENFVRDLQGTVDSPAETADRIARLSLAFVEGIFLERGIDPDFRTQDYVEEIIIAIHAILTANTGS